jgi:hypothetical protein
MLFYLFEISTSVWRIFRPISGVFWEVAWPSCWRLRIVACRGRARGYEEDDGCWEVEEFGVESHSAGFGVMTDEAEEPGDQCCPGSTLSKRQCSRQQNMEEGERKVRAQQIKYE